MLSLRDFQFRWALAAVVIIKAGMATNLVVGVARRHQKMWIVSKLSVVEAVLAILARSLLKVSHSSLWKRSSCEKHFGHALHPTLDSKRLVQQCRSPKFAAVYSTGPDHSQQPITYWLSNPGGLKSAPRLTMSACSQNASGNLLRAPSLSHDQMIRWSIAFPNWFRWRHLDSTPTVSHVMNWK